jgi:hypothetical protein
MEYRNEWRPGYYDKHGVFIEYERKWYCNETKTIHDSEKEFLKCPHCLTLQNKK